MKFKKTCGSIFSEVAVYKKDGLLFKAIRTKSRDALLLCRYEKRPDKSDLLECGGSEAAGLANQELDLKNKLQI
ncbi:hypothetical protein D8T27_23530 [Vibrio vulnificus]|nr:hypothetical protein D8T27_23530 [Vibrio vulnificus]